MTPALALLLALAAAPPSLDAPAPEQRGGEADAALVIGVSDYAFVPDVPFADRDAKAFAAHLLRTRKVPPDRVRLLVDGRAAKEDLEEGIEFLLQKAQKGGTLWVYFAGHGIPSPSGKEGLLAGVDVKQTASSVAARSLSQSWLTGKLERSKAKRVVVLLDACFSGKSREGVMLLDGLRPLVPVANAAGGANVLVLTAASGGEVSGPFPEAQQGLFSYFAIGGLRGWADLDGDGAVTADELSTYVSRGVASVLADGSRSQTPTVNAGSDDARLRWVLAGNATERGPDLASLVPGMDGAPAQQRPLPGVPAGPAPAPMPFARPSSTGIAELKLELAATGEYRICEGDGSCLTENAFIRRYRGITGQTDLDAHDGRRNLAATVGWCGASAAGLGVGGYGVYSYYSAYSSLGTSSTGTTSGFSTSTLLLGSAGLSVLALTAYPCIAAVREGDGTVYDHSLNEDEARRGIDAYNDAARRRNAVGAAPRLFELVASF